VNLSQLRTFITVVDHHSFSEAARLLGISQPAVTMQIQALESDIGAMLLDRGYRKIGLTEAGAALVPYARRILSELDEARHAIEMLSDTVTGRVTVAASTTPGQYLLPRVLGAFLKEFPEVGVTLRVYDSADVVERVEAEEADLGMTGAEVPGARVYYERLGVDELVLICPPGHPLAEQEAVTFSEVAEQPFIVREAGSGTRMVAEELVRRAGVDPGDLDVVMELGTNEAIVSASRVAWDRDREPPGGGQGARTRHGRACARRWIPSGAAPFLVLPRRLLTRAADALADHLRATM